MEGKSVKNKFILVLLGLLILVLGALYFYYSSSKQKQAEYKKGIGELNILEGEQERCSVVLSREAGTFSDYEYCQQLLQKLPQ